MQRILWFNGSSGIDTTFDPARFPYDKEKGVESADIAINVDISKTKRLSRRKGWQYTEITESSHSLFCDGGDTFYVSGDALKLYTPGVGATRGSAFVSVK